MELPVCTVCCVDIVVADVVVVVFFVFVVVVVVVFVFTTLPGSHRQVFSRTHWFVTPVIFHVFFTKLLAVTQLCVRYIKHIKTPASKNIHTLYLSCLQECVTEQTCHIRREHCHQGC